MTSIQLTLHLRPVQIDEEHQQQMAKIGFGIGIHNQDNIMGIEPGERSVRQYGLQFLSLSGLGRVQVHLWLWYGHQPLAFLFGRQERVLAGQVADEVEGQVGPVVDHRPLVVGEEIVDVGGYPGLHQGEKVGREEYEGDEKEGHLC